MMDECVSVCMCGWTRVMAYAMHDMIYTNRETIISCLIFMYYIKWTPIVVDDIRSDTT